MTNEQYGNMMVAFAKLEAKIENLEAVFSELLEAPVTENKLAVTGDIKPEHLSNFWNKEGKTKVNFKNFGSFHLGATLDDNCIWETLPEEQRNKPMGISCPCKRCSAYSVGVRE